MKKNIKNKVTVLVVLAVMFGVFQISEVQAAVPKIDKNYLFRCYKGGTLSGAFIKEKKWAPVFVENIIAGENITNIQNTKPSVAKVIRYNDFGLKVFPKSPGETIVTFQYAGKTLATKIKVVQWESPCQEFKIGNKDYAKFYEFSEGYDLFRRKKDKVAKIKIKPKKGWKLQEINLYSAQIPKGKKIKNNTKIRLSIKTECTMLNIKFKNIKTRKVQVLEFQYANGNLKSGNKYSVRVFDY